MFFLYILQQEEKSLLHQFLMGQIQDNQLADWWLSLPEDIKELNLKMTLHQIRIILKLKKAQGLQHKKLQLKYYFSSPLLLTELSIFDQE